MLGIEKSGVLGETIDVVHGSGLAWLAFGGAIVRLAGARRYESALQPTLNIYHRNVGKWARSADLAISWSAATIAAIPDIEDLGCGDGTCRWFTVIAAGRNARVWDTA